jgi:hypothetical protein
METRAVRQFPSGRAALYHECAVSRRRRLITLVDAEDERVSYMAAVAVSRPVGRQAD